MTKNADGTITLTPDDQVRLDALLELSQQRLRASGYYASACATAFMLEWNALKAFSAVEELK
jgi:hypothetical protein